MIHFRRTLSRTLRWGLLLAGVLFCAAAYAGGPAPAGQPITAAGQLQPGPDDRCPVCGMFPAKKPKSAAGMRLTDNRTYYFCSNSCLLRSHRRPDVYLGADGASIARMVVLDYFTGAPVDAERAWWVAGSDVVGPMGPALVAFAGRSDVDAFIRRHGGREVFQIKEIDDGLWQRLFPRAEK